MAARSGEILALTPEPPSLSTMRRELCPYAGLASRIRASSHPRPPPQAAPWRSFRLFAFFFFRCAVIMIVLCGDLRALQLSDYGARGWPTDRRQVVDCRDDRWRIEVGAFATLFLRPGAETLCPLHGIRSDPGTY